MFWKWKLLIRIPIDTYTYIHITPIVTDRREYYPLEYLFLMRYRNMLWILKSFETLNLSRIDKRYKIGRLLLLYYYNKKSRVLNLIHNLKKKTTHLYVGISISSTWYKSTFSQIFPQLNKEKSFVNWINISFIFRHLFEILMFTES